MSGQLYFVVDLRKEWTRKPYLTLWGADHAGYWWSLSRAGRYTAAELDERNGYTTNRRYVASRAARVGPWERFGVPCEALEALASEPDREGRWRLDEGLGPIVRNSAALRKHLVSLRYVPRPPTPTRPPTPPAQEREDMARDLKLYTFSHHPDLSTDFCIEVDDLTGYAYDVRVGANMVARDRSQWPFWGRLSRALKLAGQQGDRLDDMARAAIPFLRQLESYALRRDGGPLTALPEAITRLLSAEPVTATEGC